jgi:hypothetical protein
VDGSRENPAPGPADVGGVSAPRLVGRSPSIIERLEGGEFDAEILPTLRYFRSFQRHPLQRRPQ